jgi:thiosulfate/3-mercaptopyruvate sulfurtransferase
MASDLPPRSDPNNTVQVKLERSVSLDSRAGQDGLRAPVGLGVGRVVHRVPPSLGAPVQTSLNKKTPLARGQGSRIETFSRVYLTWLQAGQTNHHVGRNVAEQWTRSRKIPGTVANYSRLMHTRTMTGFSFDSPYLMQTDVLAGRLDEPGLRIFDCTQRLVPDPKTFLRAESCKAEFDAEHIPGAGYLDVAGELSDQGTHLRYMLPDLNELAASFARRGIGEDTRVVVYDTDSMMWSTRVWLLLRSIGFENVAVLDGGFKKWRAEGRETSNQPDTYRPASPMTVTDRSPFVDKHAVLAAMDASDNPLIHSLRPEQFIGEGIQFGRSGHIPGSVNVAASNIIDEETGMLRAPDVVRKMFADAGVDLEKPILCYCGGGIAATLDTFALTMLGAKNITVYDASMQEWAIDDSLPMVTF